SMKVIDALAAADFRQNFRLFADPIRRHQFRDRLTDHFFGRVPEYPLSGGVPTLHDSIEILADNRIVGRGDDGGKLGLKSFGRHYESAQKMRRENETRSEPQSAFDCSDCS